VPATRQLSVRPPGAGSKGTRTPRCDPEPMDGDPTGRPPEAAAPDYMLWTHLGAESVFFYPPGSVEEHLVVDHGIPSIDMHWKVKGCYDHAGDHFKQGSVQLGAVGDLLAVTHAHEQVA
jgi:hypothetical protein